MKTNQDVADSLLSMPAKDFHSFVRSAIRDRHLHRVVQRLNNQALSTDVPEAESARKALQRIGFAD